jgi:hypothetical protein
MFSHNFGIVLSANVYFLTIPAESQRSGALDNQAEKVCSLLEAGGCSGYSGTRMTGPP